VCSSGRPARRRSRKLQWISRTAKDPVKLLRAIAVLMSAQGQTVKDITMLMRVGEDYVRDVVHAVNERGFDTLNPKWRGGRSKTIAPTSPIRSWTEYPAKAA
jgi:transposase